MGSVLHKELEYKVESFLRNERGDALKQTSGNFVAHGILREEVSLLHGF